jgi:hypothetical protein
MSLRSPVRKGIHTQTDLLNTARGSCPCLNPFEELLWSLAYKMQRLRRPTSLDNSAASYQCNPGLKERISTPKRQATRLKLSAVLQLLGEVDGKIVVIVTHLNLWFRGKPNMLADHCQWNEGALVTISSRNAFLCFWLPIATEARVSLQELVWNIQSSIVLCWRLNQCCINDLCTAWNKSVWITSS